MADIPVEEEHEPKEEMKLDRHPRAESNKAEINAVVTVMTSGVQNMELSEMTLIERRKEIIGLRMYSSQPLSRTNVDLFFHVDSCSTMNLVVSLTNEGWLSTMMVLWASSPNDLLRCHRIWTLMYLLICAFTLFSAHNGIRQE